MSPAAFDKCQREGGRIRTKSLGGGKYLHICWDKAGKSHPGYVKTKSKESAKKSYARKAKRVGMLSLFPVAILSLLCGCAAGPRYTKIVSFSYTQEVRAPSGQLVGTSTGGVTYLEETSIKPEGWKKEVPAEMR